jgi:nitrogen fixation protein NifT
MKVMLRNSPKGLSVYVPKKDLEEFVVEKQHDTLWGGWVKLRNGMTLELPAMAEGTTLPVTVNAKVIGSEE